MTRLEQTLAVAASSGQGVTRETFAAAAELVRAETIHALGVECRREGDEAGYVMTWRGRTDAGLAVCVTRYGHGTADRYLPATWSVHATLVSYTSREPGVEGRVEVSAGASAASLRAAQDATEERLAHAIGVLGGGA